MITKTMLEKENATLRRRVAKLEKQLAQATPLAENKENFASLFQTMHQGVVYQNTAGEIIMANPAAERILGLSLAQMQGRTSIDPRWRAIHPDGSDFPGNEHPAMVALRTGQPVHDVVMGVYHPGQDETRWILANAEPEFRAGETQPYRVYATFNDITDRKQAEAELDRFFNMIPDMTCIASSDGYFKKVNQEWESILGYTVEELLSRPLAEFIHPDDRQATLDEVERQINGSSTIHFVNRYLSKEGSYRWLEWNATPSPDGILLYAAARDITDRKRAEDTLEQTRKTLMEAQKIAHLGSFEYIAATQTTVWSEEEYHIYGLDPAQPSPVYEVMLQTCIHPDDAALLNDTFTKALQSYLVYELEHRIIRPDGSVRWVYDRAHPYFDEQGNLIRYIGVTLDITERKQAENVVRESENRFATLFRSNPIAIGITRKPNLEIVDVNEEWCKLTGYTRDQALGHTSLELGLAKPETLRQVRGILETDGKIHDFEIPLYTHDHQERRVLISSELVELSGEACVLSSLLDITERIRAEEKLCESELRLSTIFRSSPVGIILTRLADGQVLDVNDMHLKLFGYTRDEVVGHTTTELNMYASPQDRTRFTSLLREQGKIHDVEARYRTKSGKIGDLIVSAELIDLAGEQCLLSMMSDTTERKRAEGKLHESEERLSLVMDGSQLGYWDWDIEAGSVHRNSRWAEMLGYTLDEIEFNVKQWSDLHHPDDRERAWKSIQDHLEGKTPAHRLEYRMRTKDGQYKWILDQAMVVKRDAHGKPLRMCGTHTDITERKRAEEQLEASERTLKLFVEYAPAAIAMFDTDIKYLAASRRYIIDYRLPNDNIIGRSHYEIFPEIPERWKEIHRRCLAGAVEHAEADPFPRADGTLDWVHWEIRPWYEKPNQVGGLLLFSEVITERKQAEVKLRESEQFLMESQRIANMGSWRLDLSTHKVDWSENCYRLYGFEPYEVEPTFELFKQAVHPDDMHLVDEAFNKLIQNPRPLYQELRIFDKTRRMKWIANSLSPVVERDQVVQFVGIQIDITERKQAEVALAESERRFRALIEHSTDGIVVMSAQGQVLYESPSATRLIGFTPEERMGKSGLENIYPEDLPLARAKFAQVASQPGSTVQVEYRALRKDGSVWWSQSVATNLLHEPTVQGIVINFRDITERKLADEKLRESEEKYRGLMESLDSVIATIDGNGKFLYMNDVAARQLGGTPQTLIGKTMHEVFPEPVASQQLQGVRQVIRDNQGHITENLSFVHGEPRWFRNSLQPIHDQRGQVAYVLLNSTDIHKLKTTQQELAELNRTLEERVKQAIAEIRDLYDNAPTGYHSLDSEGKFIMINQTELNWLGYPREEVLGRPFTQFITPESLPTFQNNFPVFKQRGWVRDLEFELVRKDGTLLSVLVNAILVKDEHGNYLTSRSTVFDNTERKKAEQALRESEEQNRLLFEQSPDAVLLMDEQGIVVRINNAVELLTGYPPNQLVGHTLDSCDILPSDQIQLLAAQVVKSLAEQTSFASIEFKIKRADGEIRDVGTRVFGLMFKGRPHFLATMRDITLEKQAEETLRASRDALSQANRELARASELKDEFLANMSHELRTPLNAILGLSESLLEQFMGQLNEQQIKAIALIESSGQHLLTLINDILDLSKIEAGKMTLDIVPVAVQSVANSSLAFVKELAQRKNIKLLSTVDPTIEWIMADERRLKQMLVNLLNNAVKFTADGGQVRLEVAGDAQNNRMSFSVRDTGIGIAPQDLTRLFKPFVQVDGSMTRSHEGTGLGLSLVARMAEMHGGSVSVASELGKGSCFTISLPWSNEMQNYSITQTNRSFARLDQSTVTLAKSVSTDAPLVLIAEDNETNITTLSLYLESRGYRLAIAHNGNEALTKAGEEHPAIILMDLQMPVLDGLEATRRLRRMNNSPLAHTPIIALTALAMPGDRERALEAGANEYMSKPVNLKQLVEMIESVRAK